MFCRLLLPTAVPVSCSAVAPSLHLICLMVQARLHTGACTRMKEEL